MIEFINNIDLYPFVLSLKLATTTTLILFIVSLPISWFLSQSNQKLKPAIEAIIALPIVLPPSVIGFYMLFLLSKNSFVGSFFNEYFDIDLIFNFTGLVIASCFYSLPFMIQPIQNGFENINKNIIEASYVSGKGVLATIIFIIIPNIKTSLITAIVITFAHTVGEFGIVLMVGGSIPKETKVASVAIYEFVEILDYKNAHIYSLFMLLASFLILFCVYIINKKYKNSYKTIQ